ncbi:MAG: hypothetical protein H7288_23445 [Kineosporiaceae bacterium]|nr:hypothetical protein [Aeromicrobium sp.]
MASFGGVELGKGGLAVFEVTSVSDDEEFVLRMPDGAEIVIPASSKYVVVRNCPGAGFDEVHEKAREAANRGIDMYFGQGGRPLVQAHQDSAYIVGWTSSFGWVLRIVGRNLLSTRFRATAEVRDADGNVVVQAARPPKAWHKSLRYYRVSEASTDLYDSFRNLYLAIESLLSEVVPPVTRANDKLEGDSEWLKRSLRELGQTLDLRPYAPVSPKAPHNAIHHELYENLRTAIFHAKTGRRTWVPQEWSSRATIVAARVRYARLFGALASQHLDIPYPAGGFFKAHWEQGWEANLADQEVFLSNDSTKVEDEAVGKYQLAPAGGDFMRLPTSPAEDMAADWRRGVLGVEVASTVHETLERVSRFGTLHDGELAIVDNLQAPLVVDGLARLEVVLLVEGRNYGQPRQDFET